jgi:hypothetical protein
LLVDHACVDDLLGVVALVGEFGSVALAASDVQLVKGGLLTAVALIHNLSSIIPILALDVDLIKRDRLFTAVQILDPRRVAVTANSDLFAFNPLCASQTTVLDIYRSSVPGLELIDGNPLSARKIRLKRGYFYLPPPLWPPAP